MDLKIERAEVWAASIQDQSGALAEVLGELKAAGADLAFIIARRQPGKPGSGVAFVTPIRGDAQIAAATRLGFRATSSVHSVRVEGADRPGIGADLTAKMAAAGINLRGLSAAVIGDRFVMYVGLDNEADAAKVVTALRQA
ncbi:MAG: ACT domain-containing protein [Armatimonadetes bacterium]|nr:ACT domain-containing protein [Armatimonadota bacterium]